MPGTDGTRTVGRSRARACVALVTAGLASGCAGLSKNTAPPQTPLMKAVGVKANALDLRAATNYLAVRVPGAIEASADAIMARSPDPAVRRRALVWKMELVPAFYEALFQPDPLAALMDAWALSVQVEHYIETGPGRGALGDEQPAGLATARLVRADLESEARNLAGTDERLDRVRSGVEKWARKHPIEGPLSSRPSAMPLLAEMAGESETNVFLALGDITTTVSDLSTRLNIYAAYLPKAARWQGELLADDLGGRSEARQAVATLRSIHETSGRMNELLAPGGLENAAAPLVAELRAERIAALAEVDRQRSDSLAYLTSEREAAMAAVNALRAGAFGDVDHQRLLLMQQAEELSRRTLADAERLAGRIVRQVTLAAAALLVLAAVLALAILRLGKPRRGATTPP